MERSRAKSFLPETVQEQFLALVEKRKAIIFGTGRSKVEA